MKTDFSKTSRETPVNDSQMPEKFSRCYDN